MSGTPIRDAGVALEHPSRAEQIAELRSRMSALGGKLPRPAVEEADVVQLDGDLRTLFPSGGVPRRAVSHLSDTAALAVEMIEQITAGGGFVGVVGWPELSYAGITPEHLEHVVAVPDPGIDALSVAGVLAEGLDLVVLRTAHSLELSPVRARPVLAKLRKGNAALLSVGTRVPSAALEITAEVTGIHGIGRGTGRIRGIDLKVRVAAKGARPASRVITLGAGPDTPRPALRVVG
ncbi:hypothetical protein [Corynebacterium mayonis]|uniref:hypothetical protein n=1 Tax=Corynebacterium mayonis TaxID=3062461 RepID=UPI003140523C